MEIKTVAALAALAMVIGCGRGAQPQSGAEVDVEATAALPEPAPASPGPVIAPGLWRTQVEGGGWAHLCHGPFGGDLLITPSDMDDGAARCGAAVDRREGDRWVREFSCRGEPESGRVLLTLAGDLSTRFSMSLELPDAPGRRTGPSIEYSRVAACPQGWRPGDLVDSEGRTGQMWQSENRVTNIQSEVPALSAEILGRR